MSDRDALLAEITARVEADVKVEAARLLADLDQPRPRQASTSRTRRFYADPEPGAPESENVAAQEVPTPTDQVARAKQHGMVARAEYMTPEAEAKALKPSPNGLLDARLERVRDRLLVVTPAGWVNPKSRSAHKAGLHSFQIRGTSYHQAAVEAGRFTPGTPVRLVREPDNPHDPNAIAVYSQGARTAAGYVPAARAKLLARLFDDGVDLVAVSVRGSGPGQDGTVPHILVCERRQLDHLNRR